MAALLAVQVLINTGVTVGLLPVTGLPLPLVSYGGSGLWPTAWRWGWCSMWPCGPDMR